MEEKTMRQLRLAELIGWAADNYARADLAIMHLEEDFEDGTIRACQARKEYRKMRESLVIHGKRYERLKRAHDGEPDKVYFSEEHLVKYDNYFGYERVNE